MAETEPPTAGVPARAPERPPALAPERLAPLQGVHEDVAEPPRRKLVAELARCAGKDRERAVVDRDHLADPQQLDGEGRFPGAPCRRAAGAVR